jgi:ActR/RegA family two-component response regulator
MNPKAPVKPPLLLLDDDKKLLEELRLHLEDEGFAVTAVHTIADARAALSDPSRFSVFVSDMFFGHEAPAGGLELALRLARQEVRPQIVVITAYGSIANADRCMQSGVFAYVEKGLAKFGSDLVKAAWDAHARWLDRYIPEKVDFFHEAIAVIDLVGSTSSSIQHGWDKLGRPRYRKLRELVVRHVPQFGLYCHKSTGDGYLLTFRNETTASLAAAQALRAVITLCKEVKKHNQGGALPINLRAALHYGEVDVIQGDREGVEVAFTFRLESLGKEARSAPDAKWPPDPMPQEDYAILSKPFASCLSGDALLTGAEPFDGVNLKSFGKRDVYLLRKLSEVSISS